MGWVPLIGQAELNTAERMMKDENKLSIGGYGQVDFNQELNGDEFRNGNLDVHRLVIMLGYKFSSKTQVISEIEFEHVKEVYVEQAFLQHEIKPWLKLRAGLMLVPMGIINEYHEPSTFNGVERPNLDKYIVPTTWREIGAGFTGAISSASLSYQVYVMNGFKGYDNGALLSGSSGFRKGRQKGAESMITSPSLAFRINHYGIRGLQLGFSAYTGKTQSSMYDGLDRNDAMAIAQADSSVVGFSMLGLDARYNLGGFALRGQLNYGWVSHSESFNQFTGSDLGRSLGGWYAELAYDLFHAYERLESALLPFIRFESYNTQLSMDGSFNPDPAFSRQDLTMGIGWKLHQGAMLKLDYQRFTNKADKQALNQINAGVAFWF
jgi:hypothetical protein